MQGNCAIGEKLCRNLLFDNEFSNNSEPADYQSIVVKAQRQSK